MLTLIRLISTADISRGIFLANGDIVCYSLELPWKGNLRNVSCIPFGSYRCSKQYSARFGHCLRLFDVPDRSDILIHPGNVLADTQGCILPGLDVSHQSVLQSKNALQRILLNVPSSFTLDIRGL